MTNTSTPSNGSQVLSSLIVQRDGPAALTVEMSLDFSGLPGASIISNDLSLLVSTLEVALERYLTLSGRGLTSTEGSCIGESRGAQTTKSSDARQSNSVEELPPISPAGERWTRTELQDWVRSSATKAVGSQSFEGLGQLQSAERGYKRPPMT
jgi:hypothetical protein